MDTGPFNGEQKHVLLTDLNLRIPIKMLNRLQPLENEQLATLHNACMKILSKVGVVFHEAEALEVFNKHGFRVDGEKVFFSENKVLKALETVPSEFTIQARNPEKSVTIGGDHFVFGPGWGAPLIIDANGPVDISEESIGLDLIERVGNSGNYMMTDETLMGCRTAFFPSCLAQRGTYEEWCQKDLGNTAQIAAKHVEERLEAYVKPDNDPTMEKDLKRYVAAKSNG